MKLDSTLIRRAQAGARSARRLRSTRPELSCLEERSLPSTTSAIQSTHGLSAASKSHVAETSSSALPAVRGQSAVASLTPIERLAYYDPTSTTGQYFTPVSPNDPRLVGKDVYVLVHGYAPGYRDWVTNAADMGHFVLKWWQTIPADYAGGANNPTYKMIKSYAGTKPGDSSGPVSPWLLDGHSVSPAGQKTFVVSANGLAEDLMASDPNAAVLAYTWLDNSATSAASVTIKGLPFQVPLDAYKSEAMTTLNGERLAVGLEQALGSQTHFGGQLQLIGHSHGSKVATVAAVALTHDTVDPLHVNQLTILDSPESNSGALGTVGFSLAKLGATNDNWYFLQDLNISKNPSGTNLRGQLHLGARRTLQRHFIPEFEFDVEERRRRASSPLAGPGQRPSQRAQLRSLLVRRIVGAGTHQRQQRRQRVVASVEEFQRQCSVFQLPMADVAHLQKQRRESVLSFSTAGSFKQSDFRFRNPEAW